MKILNIPKTNLLAVISVLSSVSYIDLVNFNTGLSVHRL